MMILAIDPSSSALGVAVFSDFTPLENFTFKSKGETFEDRMLTVIREIKQILEKHSIDYVAIETPYVGISKSTAMKMGQIFGMILATLMLNGIAPNCIINIHPMTAKKAVGMGKVMRRDVGKDFVMNEMKIRFPLLNITDDNQADALAVGLAGLEKLKEEYERQSGAE